MTLNAHRPPPPAGATIKVLRCTSTRMHATQDSTAAVPVTCNLPVRAQLTQPVTPWSPSELAARAYAWHCWQWYVHSTTSTLRLASESPSHGPLAGPSDSDTVTSRCRATLSARRLHTLLGFYRPLNRRGRQTGGRTSHGATVLCLPLLVRSGQVGMPSESHSQPTRQRKETAESSVITGAP